MRISCLGSKSSTLGVGASRISPAAADTTFNSREVMDRNRYRARTMKQMCVNETGAAELDEAEFDVAFAHLRVRELA